MRPCGTRLKFKFSKIQENVFGLIRAKAPVSEYEYSPPLRSASAKSSFPPYFLRTKSNKKPGNPSSRFPDPPWRPRGTSFPLGIPSPQAPSGTACCKIYTAGNKKYPSISCLKGMYQIYHHFLFLVIQFFEGRKQLLFFCFQFHAQKFVNRDIQ